MAEERVGVVFAVKNDEFNRSLKDINTQLKLTKSDLNITSESIKQFGNNTKDLTNKSKSLELNIKTLNDKMKLYQDNVGKNTSKLNDNKKQLELLGAEKEKANKKYKEAIDLYGKESEEAKKANKELDVAKEKYKEKENQINNNIKAINKHNTELNNTQAELVKVQGELDKTNKKLAEESSGFLNASKSLDKAQEKFDAVGRGLNNVGNNMIKFSAPMATAGVAMAKMSSDFEESLAKVSTLLSGSSMDISEYKDAIIALSNDTGKGVNELSDSLYEALSAGVDASQAISFVEQANKLATGGFTDSTKAVDLLTTTLNAYGLEVSETGRINDILIQTQNKGKTTIDQLASSMGKVIPTAKASNVSIEQLGASYAILTSKGIATAEATTYLNSLLNEMSKSGTKSSDVLKELTGKGFSELVSEGKSVGDILDLINKYAQANGLALNDMFGSAEAAKAGMVLVEGEGQAFNDMLSSMNNSVGSADEAFKKMDETTNNKLAKSVNKLKNSFLDAGEELSPLIDMASEGIDKISEAISKMDADTIASVAKFAALTMALGAVTKVTGGFVSGIGSVCGGLSKLTGWIGKTQVETKTLGTVAGAVTKGGISTLASGLGGLTSVIAPVGVALAGVGAAMYVAKESTDFFNSSVLKSEESMSLVEKATAKLNGATTFTRKEMEELGYVFKEFEGITPEVADGLELVADKTRDLNLAIDSVNFDGVISEEEMKSIQGKTQDWCDTIITTIKSNESEVNTSISSLFEADGVVTESEQMVLDILGKSNEEKIKIVEDANKRINDIVKQAGDEHRELNSSELSEIKSETDKANKALLDSYNLSAEERLSAQNLFFQKCNSQSAESLQKDLEIERQGIEERKQIVKEKYDAGIEALKAAIPQMEESQRALAEAELKAQVEQRDKLLSNEEQKWLDIIGTCETQYPSYMKLINKYNGEILTQADIDTQRELENMKQKYEGINQITESGLYKVWDTTKKQYDNVRVVVDDNTGDIIGLYSELYNETAGYSENIRKDLAKTSMEYNLKLVNIKADLRNWATASVDSNGEVIDANGNVVGSIVEMEEAIKRTTGKDIKIDVDNGVITNLQDIMDKLDWINRFKINPKYVDVSYTTSGGNNLVPYATGTSGTDKAGMALVNEKGWELVDTMTQQARAVQSLGGDLAYLPSNTKVTTHLASTAKMQSEVKQQVSQQLNYNLNSALRSIDDSLKSLKSTSPTNNDELANRFNEYNNTVINALDTIKKSLDKDMPKLVAEVYNVIDNKVIAKGVVPFLPKEQNRYESNYMR